jgi:hypothetical protein
MSKNYSPEKEMSQEVFKKIEKRLADFNPPIELRKHIADFDLNIGKKFVPRVTTKRDTLDGVNFLIKDRVALLTALRAPKDSVGEPALAEGSSEDKKHWSKMGIQGDPSHYALNWSYLATNGIGFREVYHQRLNDRELRIRDARPPLLNAPEMDGRFSANFGDSFSDPDYSAIHFGVGTDNTTKVPLHVANVHIDKLGFVLVGPDGKPVVGPNFLRHWGEELKIKTDLRAALSKYIGEKYANAFIDRVTLGLPSTQNDASKLSVSFDLVQRENFRWMITGSCGLMTGNGFECSVTTSVTGRHGIFGSK